MFFSRLPPPTENTNTRVLLAAAGCPSAMPTNTVSQPSSLVRAVSSETLSVGA